MPEDQEGRSEALRQEATAFLQPMILDYASPLSPITSLEVTPLTSWHGQTSISMSFTTIDSKLTFTCWEAICLSR